MNSSYGKSVHLIFSFLICYNLLWINHALSEENKLITALNAGKSDSEILSIIEEIQADPTTHSQLVEKNSTNGDNPLTMAIRLKRTDLVTKLLTVDEVKASINEQNKYGNTALMVALRWGDNDKITKQLLKIDNIDVNIPNSYGSSPLMWASRQGKLDLVKSLVNKGAKLDDQHIKNKLQSNALLWAAKENKNDIVDFLLTNEKTSSPYSEIIDHHNNMGKNPLAWSIHHKNSLIFTNLIKNGSSLKEKNKNGKSYLDLINDLDLSNPHNRLIKFIATEMNNNKTASVCKETLKNFPLHGNVNVEEFYNELKSILVKNKDKDKNKAKKENQPLDLALYEMLDDQGKELSWPDALKNKKMMPKGSAIYTPLAQPIEGTNIKAIIHAATGSMDSSLDQKSESFFKPTLKSVDHAVRNAISLAANSTQNHQSIAIPFIGGDIFARRIFKTPDGEAVSKEQLRELAETIIKAAVDQNKKSGNKLTLNFIDFANGDDFSEAAKTLAPLGTKVKIIKKGDLLDSTKNGGADVIINAANIEVEFGGGISGAIASKLGAQKIDVENQIKQLKQEVFSNVKFKGKEKESDSEDDDKDEDKNKKADEVKIKMTGEALTGEGIFTKDCEYDTSISDHAPVIYKNSKIATWNITFPVDKTLKEFNGTKFFNHKFKMNEKFKNEVGNDINLYKDRLLKIADVIINKIMIDKDIKVLAIQELSRNKGDFKEFKQILKENGLQLVYQKYSFKGKEYARDTAIITRIDRSINVIEDKELQRPTWMQSCTDEECFVSVHNKWDEDIKTLCKEMKKVATELKSKSGGKYKKVHFVGDFNHTHHDYSNKCKEELAKATINTYNGDGMSCAGNLEQQQDNNKKMSLHKEGNIDMLITF